MAFEIIRFAILLYNMNLTTKYEPQSSENKWYSLWMTKGFFHSEPDEREPYTIVIPPPNVTGVLHMGHMLNNTIQDVLIRRARMLGKNACWVPGTDHASIATEAKVVAMLKERGINKSDLTREEFLKYAWEWKEKYGGIILEQLKKLGASCDWDRTRFTMEDDLSESVIDTFIHLYEKGLIYRGVRMINWDPSGKTAVSDEEVIRKEVQQKLYYINYQVEGTSDFLTVATTRPETIMADAAICVNPLDERFSALKGKSVIIPLINRKIPIIEDSYVDMEFGTGCLKVTPAHDLNDYEIGIRHNLPVIDILNDDGTLNVKAEILVGEDRAIARKKIAKLLEESGNLSKIEDYKSQVGFSERTDAVIEPRLSMQWFCKMDDLVKPALDDVLNGEIKLIPEKFINTYKHWMENVRDWNISRQLWWGQRIPAWYLPDGSFVVAKTAEQALEKALLKNPDLKLADLKQEDDVLDTWFSSGLWPITVFDGLKDPNNKDINYYYPTNDLVTAPEILFFWVARMIMFGHEFRGKKPFNNVYLTGIVRDKLGRKMSKSLGNSPDPIGLIEEYGADGVRVGMLLCSPAGNDLMFDASYIEQGRNFANKIWNAFRLVKGWEVDNNLPNTNQTAILWFKNRFNEALKEIEENFNNYRLSEALMASYKLVWDDFCAWYLEMVKPAYQQPIDAESYAQTVEFFELILKLLHPFMPFITEELWHNDLFKTRGENDFCIVASYPVSSEFENEILNQGKAVKAIISEIRNLRNKQQISPKTTLDLFIKPHTENLFANWENVIKQLGNINEFTITNNLPNGIGFFIGKDEFLIPLEIEVDKAAELEKLNDELVYYQGFLKSVNAKLNNEKFVQNAKESIIENERNKKADAESKIALIEQSIRALNL